MAKHAALTTARAGGPGAARHAAVGRGAPQPASAAAGPRRSRSAGRPSGQPTRRTNHAASRSVEHPIRETTPHAAVKTPGGTAKAPHVRRLSRRDLAEVIRIDAYHTGARKTDYWRRIFREFFGTRGGGGRVALAAEVEGRLAGYLLGEVRAFEFGSEPCGWVFAVAVDAPYLRRGVASRLLDEACRRFARAGVATVRTMVRRNDVPVLSFFRASGFAGGPYVQLERGVGDASVW